MEAVSNILEASSVLTEEVAASEQHLRKSLIEKYMSQRIHSSEILKLSFKSGLDWINCSKALSFSKELKGKLVILDFFTYCCINCMHILPQLRNLEHEFSVQDGLVVIGVHSPKFPNERSTLNVKSAVKRYGITHPVVNDPEEHLWTELGICCWPTLVIIGPGGELLLYLLGESHEQLLQLFVRESLSLLKTQGKISSHPIPEVGVDQEFSRVGPLSFPGKLCVSKTTSGHEIAIADTGHHRVLVVDQNGEVQHVVGGDESGFKDGSYTEARFNAPQGLAFLDQNTLFVADTENHALRKVNLAAGTVVTVAGDGVQGDDMVGGEVGKQQRLSSPWDITPLSVSVLLVAMAGSHQLWAYFLQDITFWRNKHYVAESCAAVAGSGREENRNNAYPQSAGFAQPSGLTLAPARDTLYVADSESSTVRAVSVTDGKVSALVGGTMDPQNLFAYGDVDGMGQVAKLQHPLSVAWSEYKQALYVCDSYNHKLKVVNVNSKNCSTLSGSFQLNEPGGLCAIDNLLYVADTNNHCIKIINLDDLSSKTMQISFKESEEKVKKKTVEPMKEVEVAISSDGGVLELSISVQISADAVCKLVPDSPAIWALPLPDGWQETKHEDFPESITKKWWVSVPKSDNEMNNQLMPSCRVFFCQNNLCFARTLPFLVTVIFDDKAAPSVSSHIDYAFTP